MADNSILELSIIETSHFKCYSERALEAGRHIFNSTLAYALNNWNSMKQLSIYRLLLSEYTKAKNSKKKEDKTYKECLALDLTELRYKYKLSKYQLESFATDYKNNHGYDKYLDSNTILNIAGRVWDSISKIMFYKGKRVHFCKYGNFNTLEGKTNKQGIRFIKKGETLRNKKLDNHTVVWNGIRVLVKIRGNDIFAHEMIATKKVKYCRLIRKLVKGKYKWYVQLVLEGAPCPKRNKDGSFRNKVSLGKRIGLDEGTTTLATVSENSVSLEKLGNDEIDYLAKKINRLNRKLTRSRIKTNPENFNQDGTVKRGKKLTWVRSKNYMKTLFALKECYRLKAVKLKLSHRILANSILELGTEVYIEKMNFKALAKKSKETVISKKTNRIKSKKRFGSSITNYAPAMFQSILEQKLKYLGLELHKVNTTTFKASQYDHFKDRCIKKSLSSRWKYIDKYKIQRDLYSAFLLMNSDDSLKHTNRDFCIKTFNNFLKLHNEEINRLKNTIDKLPTSFGIKQEIV